jgi:addiction module RelE/StbE family toxin
MWAVLETREATKALDKAPADVVRKFQAWTAIVQQSGVQGLRAVRGFHGEALAGAWAGFRSSRLSLQWRVIYRVEASEVTVHVVRVTPHDYRR